MTSQDTRVDDAPASVPATASPRPIEWWRRFGRPPRIMGLDVARALAVLGMVGAHIGVTTEFELLDPSTWAELVHGRSSILFAVLAGISIALMTGRTRQPEPEELPRIRLALLGRGAAIFVIGLALELLGTPIAVILTVYGMLYVVAIPFLRWRVRHLLIAAGVLAVAGPPLLALVQALSLGASGPGLELALFGTYPITVWMAFVLAGMAIGRLRLQRARTAIVLLIVGVALSAVGYGVAAAAQGVAFGDEYTSIADSSSPSDDAAAGDMLSGVVVDGSDLDGTVCDSFGDGTFYCYPPDGVEIIDEGGVDEGGVPGSEGGWAGYPSAVAEYEPLVSMAQSLVSADPHTGGTAEILGSGGFAIALIALCLLAARPLRWVLLPLAALGSMPLSAYSAHILAIVVIAGPGGFLSGNAEWGWFSLALLVAATLWAAFFGRGPLERLVGRAARAMAGGSAGLSADRASSTAPTSAAGSRLDS